MAERPYVLLSCAVSIDGFLDDAAPRPLRLSNPADLDRVDAVRASCDAILVGAATVRNDNPRLEVRDPARRAARTSHGLGPSPKKVTVTAHGELDEHARFFSVGHAEKLVYCPSSSVADVRRRVGAVSTVVDVGATPRMRGIGEDLYRRGVRRLMVEGGATVLTQFLAEELADELHLVVAPFFVGGPGGRRLHTDGPVPWDTGRRARLAEVRQLEDVVLLRYALSARCPCG